MFRVWRNPLLILHMRSDLRPARAALVAAFALIVCILIAMGCWSANPYDTRGFGRDFYAWLLGAQFLGLGVWSAGTCGQAIARERELKTFDFLKTTRLTPGEMMVGKLLGAPIVAYFAVACTLPITIVTGLAVGIRPVAVFGSIVLLLFFNLFYSLVALLASMLVEKSSAGAVGLVGLIANGFFLAFADGPFKGFAAISVMPAILSLYHADVDIVRTSPTVFGLAVPYTILSVVLYILLGAWLVLMIVPNFKKDLPQIQLLSRWQCVGLIAFCNLLFYAFFDTDALTLEKVYHQPMYRPWEIVAGGIGWNAVLLFLIGVAALTPHEKLKVWWRKWKAGSSSYFAANGLPWPWLVPAALIGYGMLAAEAFLLRSAIPLSEWRLGFAAMAFGAFLVFTARDILFLQWCLLTRMKQPVMKGVLLLILYNAAVGLFAVVIDVIASPAMPKVLSLLTPYVLVTETDKPVIPSAFTLTGMGLQLVVCVLILLAIQRRLARPVHAPVAGAA